MPAYRSPAEGEIRDAVVARIRLSRPGARIIHEINCAGQGTNRIDLIAVDVAEIIAVEVKSAKDKIDRLPAQITAMSGVAHHVVAALHEKFLVPSPWKDGSVQAPKEARGAVVWAFPDVSVGRCYDCNSWRPLRVALDMAVPSDAIWMLWRNELYWLCGSLRVSVGNRATISEMARALRWHCNGKELTRGICAALRARRCIEADPEIERAAA